MLRTICCVYVSVLALTGTFAGCMTAQPRICKKPTVEHGWVTIGGSSIPGATVTVEAYGKSLVHCLNESQTTSILSDRARIVNSPTRQPIQQPTESDLKSVASLLESPLANKAGVSFEKEIATRYDQLVVEMDTLHRDFPGIGIPETWSVGWPAYLVEDPRNTQGMERLAEKIDRMPESQFKAEATQSFLKLQAKKLPPVDRSEILQQLSALARDGKIAVEPSEKIRAWCFASVGALKKQNDPPVGVVENQKEKRDSEILQFQQKAEPFVKELKSLKVAELKSQTIGPNGFEMVVAPYIPEEALLINQERYIMPLEMAYESELGGLWLFPGDRVEIVRFRELPASQTEEGERRVGVMGLTVQPGILQTQGAVASAVIYDVGSDIDPRANLLSITNEWNGVIVHTLLPYGGACQVSSKTRANIDSLLNQWAIQDGTLVKFEMSQLSPIMIRSRAYQQNAAREVAQFATSLSDCKENCLPKHHMPATAANQPQSGLKLPSSPIVENGCKVVSDTASRTGTAVKDFGSNLWNTFAP